MEKTGGVIDIKKSNRIRIMKYMLECKNASRQQISTDLKLSAPTVIGAIKELIEKNLICEAGEYRSNGGRKAKALAIRKGVWCAIGIGISNHHIQLTLSDLNGDLLALERVRYPFEDTQDYYRNLGNVVQQFICKNKIDSEGQSKLIGVGLSLPGIVDNEKGVITQSLALHVKDLRISKIMQYIPYPYVCSSHSEASVYTTVTNKKRNIVSIFLNDDISGAAFLNGEVYKGDCCKSTLFGHMVIIPNGRLCYCGKRGCLNAYCSSLALKSMAEVSPDQFFAGLSTGNAKYKDIWDEYLEYLAIGITNLRMMFDCDIVISGDLSSYVRAYMPELEQKIQKTNLFDVDASYLQFGKYNYGVFAYGAACMMIRKFIVESDLLS